MLARKQVFSRNRNYFISDFDIRNGIEINFKTAAAQSRFHGNDTDDASMA